MMWLLAAVARMGAPMSWLTGEWSSLHRVSDRETGAWFHSCQDRPGVYRLIGLRDGTSFEAKPLPRACGEDRLGTLYIGAATRSLTGRLGRLVLQHSPGRKGGHAAMPTALARAFPDDRLAVCWCYAAHGTDVFAMERALLVGYRDLFGERPPLNTMG